MLKQGLDFILNKNTRVLILGSLPNMDILNSKIDSLCLNDSVFVLPKVSDDDLPLYYSRSSVFVLPTKHLGELDVEGFGIVFLEAGSYNLPVVGGKTGGVFDAIKDGETGFLVNPNNQEELFSKINLLLSNVNLRNRMGFNGLKNSRSYFLQ